MLFRWSRKRTPTPTDVPLITVDATKAFRANGICMPLHKTPKPTWPRVLVCSIACLPDERHITGPRFGSAIVDTDRVCASHLDVNEVVEVDEHDVVPCCVTKSLGDGRAVRRFQADPLDEGAGKM